MASQTPPTQYGYQPPPQLGGSGTSSPPGAPGTGGTTYPDGSYKDASGNAYPGNPYYAGYGNNPGNPENNLPGGYTAVGGNTSSTDPFGIGEYQVSPVYSQTGAYNNPVGAQAGRQLSGELNTYLPNTTQNVTAAQAAGGNTKNYNTGTAGQLGLANKYNQMAAGNGPSAAAITAQQQGQANLAASESMLGSARGSGSPAAARIAARNAAATGQQQVARNAVAGRTQEELGAMNAAGSLYGNVASQGLNEQQLGAQSNQFNAGQQNQIAAGNQANTLAANTNYMNQLGTQNIAQQQGQIAEDEQSQQTQLAIQQQQAQSYQASQAANAKLTGSVFSAMGGAMSAMSDKRAKKKIKSVSKNDMDNFINNNQLGAK